MTPPQPVPNLSKEGGGAGPTLLKLPERKGGKVSRNTIREQLIYEIHDPANYITPDVIVDFTAVKIEEIASNKVQFSGVKGNHDLSN